MANEQAAKRLREARAAAGFDSAKSAAEAMGVPVPSYIQHENGGRGYKRDSALKYARRFRTTPEWLLFGKGASPQPVSDPSATDLEQMIREAIEDVVTLETRLSDLPRIVAPALHEQLERFRADRVAQDLSGERPSPDKSVQSPAATRQDDSGGRRNA